MTVVLPFHPPGPPRLREGGNRLRIAQTASVYVVAALGCSDPGAQPQVQSAPIEPPAPSVEGPLAPATPSASASAATKSPSCPAGMAAIPEATFVVSADTKDARELGSPTRVKAYCLDRTEVTTEAYAGCMKSGRCSAPITGGSCTYGRAGTDKQPINCVGFVQAKEFCATQGKRLPTEAEWESAASAGVRTYPWGEEPPGKGVCWDGKENALGYGKRHDSCDVGTFDADVTPEGVRDLGGNVTEWTEPVGVATGRDPNQTAVRRGGTWGTKSGPYLLRTTSRRVGDYQEYQSGIFTGFRCAMDLAAPSRIVTP